MNLSVIGLGKLGSPLAAVLARAGHVVVGADIAEAAVSAVNSRRAPVEETGLQAVITAADGRLTATTNVQHAVGSSDFTFVIVPTPSGADGTFVLDHVLTAVAGIGDALSENPHREHMVIIVSTVMPGSTAGSIRDTLEQHARRQVGEALDLCYSPEFIALGSVIHDMTHPDLILIGSTSDRAATRLEELLRTFVEGSPPAMHLSLIDAEIAKLAVNAYVTTKISYANMIAEVCEQIPGADASAVTNALGLDSRVGSKYLRPGAAYGGPCFPRDNIALSAFARSVGASADIAEATNTINLRQTERLCKLVMGHRQSDEKVAVLGLTYKVATDVVEAAPGMALAGALVTRGIPVIVHDPKGMANARHVLAEQVTYANDVASAVAQAAVVVITTPWPEYQGVPALEADRTVIDCWGLCSEFTAAGTRVVTPGRQQALKIPLTTDN